MIRTDHPAFLILLDKLGDQVHNYLYRMKDGIMTIVPKEKRQLTAFGPDRIVTDALFISGLWTVLCASDNHLPVDNCIDGDLINVMSSGFNLYDVNQMGPMPYGQPANAELVRFNDEAPY